MSATPLHDQVSPLVPHEHEHQMQKTGRALERACVTRSQASFRTARRCELATTTRPELSFLPSAPLSGAHELLHATLPSMENLTPLVKFLPCKAHSGLARLPNPNVIFAAPFRGLNVHYGRGEPNLPMHVVLTPAAAKDWPCQPICWNASPTPPFETTHTPTTLEPVLRLPLLPRVRLEVKVEHSFLLYTQHPPDAQRGWDLPPAVITVLAKCDSRGPEGEDPRPAHRERPMEPQLAPRLRWCNARTLLADLTTPNPPMPYNVILTSSTLVALLFGTVFNLLGCVFVVVQAK